MSREKKERRQTIFREKQKHKIRTKRYTAYYTMHKIILFACKKFDRKVYELKKMRKFLNIRNIS